MKHIIYFLFCILSLPNNILAQNNSYLDTTPILSGNIIDQNNTPLPYVNIISLNTGKGTISNTDGDFSINIHPLNDTNIIRFQCIGYTTKEYKIKDLRQSPSILLSENIYSLDEVLILGTIPDPRKIMRNILKNKDINYNTINKKKQAFIRERSTVDILKLKLDYTKNNIEVITPEMLQLVEKHTPRNIQSYSDLLTNIYIKKDQLKINPIKLVELKGKNVKQLEMLGDTFTKLIKDTEDNEYWRVKTGIIGTKIPPANNDSLETNASNKENTKEYKYKAKKSLEFATFENKQQWEFLYKIDKYNFEIIGGTSINNEKVYVIDFSPKEKGLYEGRLYVSIETSALIKADYKYAPGKLGIDAKLFGFSQTNTNFTGSIYFEKDKTNYNLKYLSFQDNNKYGVKRKVALQKKKKRFLMNKKLKEIEISVDLIMEEKASIELLIIDHSKISASEFDNITEKKHINITYVNQFNKDLWKRHITIEPTKEMREYQDK